MELLICPSILPAQHGFFIPDISPEGDEPTETMLSSGTTLIKSRKWLMVSRG
jgi:hypothetical protein